MPLDQDMEAFSNLLYSKLITYSLISWNWLSWAFMSGMEFTHKTAMGAIDAHRDDVWIFRERNENPWSVKEDVIVNGRVNFVNLAYWHPSEASLYFTGSDVKNSHNFGSVVSAELYNSDKSLHYDLSSFFHNFYWQGESISPSLYEVVLLYCLTNNLFFSKAQLAVFTLEVLTADSQTVRLRLDSSNALVNFEDWATYEVASAT